MNSRSPLVFSPMGSVPAIPVLEARDVILAPGGLMLFSRMGGKKEIKRD